MKRYIICPCSLKEIRMINDNCIMIDKHFHDHFCRKLREEEFYCDSECNKGKRRRSGIFTFLSFLNSIFILFNFIKDITGIESYTIPTFLFYPYW